MKDYYEILNISLDSSTKDIKRAYFKLIRKYTPDNNPEEFKQIREAYETLSDEQTR